MTAEFPFMRPTNESGKRVSFILAVIVHLLLAGFLFYGVRWQTKATDIVEVELISSVPSPGAKPVESRQEEPPPLANRAEPKPMPQPSKPDIAIKEPEAKPRVDPFQEQLKREAEKLNSRKMEDSVAQELSKIRSEQEAKAAATRNKAVANYISRIIGAIRPKIALPPDLTGNPEAVFQVTQLPGGEILNVVLKRSSGNPVLDSNIERAILKSSPLPKPEQSDIFSRELNLTFRPLEN